MCDSDLIFGDLDKFTCRDVDVFSTHAGFISGHFFYVRNNPYNNNVFKSIRSWKSALISDQHYGLDEGSWSNIFIPKSSAAKLRKVILSLLGMKIKVVAVELFTTPNSAPWTDGTYEYPKYWIYGGGCMVAMNKGVAFEVPYLHFMNWKPGAKYLPRRHEKPLWDGVSLSNCNHIWRDLRIKISAAVLRRFNFYQY